MLKRKLIVPLSIWAKSAHAFTNAIFSMFESIFLALIIFYAIRVDAEIYIISISVGLMLILSAVVTPLVTFLIDRFDNLFFGTYHAPLIISIFVISIFNAQFWTIGELNMSNFATISIIMILAFINHIFMAVYRYCTHSIGDRICFDKNDKNLFNNLKATAFVIGVLLAIIIVGVFINYGFKISHIGFVCSIIMLVFGLVDFFITFQYLPFIKLKEATKKITTKEKLKDIYLDFILSISLKGQIKQFLAFCCSVIFFAMLFVVAYVYMFAFTSSALEASFIVGTALLACVLGVIIFVKIFKSYSSNKIVKTNLMATIVWVIIFSVFYALTAVGVLEFQYWLMYIIVGVLGFLASVNYVTFNNLFISKLKSKAPFNLCTIVYIFCFGLVTIIIGAFASSYKYEDSLMIVNLGIMGNAIFAVIAYIAAAVLFMFLIMDDKIRPLKTKKVRVKKIYDRIDRDNLDTIEVSVEVVE